MSSDSETGFEEEEDIDGFVNKIIIPFLFSPGIQKRKYYKDVLSAWIRHKARNVGKWTMMERMNGVCVITAFSIPIWNPSAAKIH